ncbi:MAG: twin-arginine translocase subunit TatC [Bacteroidetes bacterium]|jgi:sec-independent protein translocase protein TatC|nr:twin-arginine translocase subunit TatC [Bacteroidota bacterium]
MALDQPTDKKNEEAEMGFLDHLEELRKRLFWSTAFILTTGITLFVCKEWLFETVLFGPRRIDFASFRAWCWISEAIGAGDALCVQEIRYELINTTMLGNFTTHILVSAIGGFILSFPLVFWQGWLFIRPALKQTEVKAASGIGLSSSVLFFLGVAFGYWIIAPLSLQFLGNYELGDVEARISVMSYMKTIASITLAAGLIFQLPVVVYFLSRAGLVTPEILKSYRKHALVAILIIAAIITPPDLTSQILVALPVLVLYELSIVISRRVVKQNTERT